MRAVGRIRHLWPLGLVGLGAVYVAWLGFGVETTGDYASWFAPAMNALLAGHLTDFFKLLPHDGAGGSILLRAPGALIGRWLGGGQLAEFRFGALECVLALGALGLLLAREPRFAQARAGRVLVIGLCVLLPEALDVVLLGHPEEALGAALSVGAVLLAGSGRSSLAGIAVGLAILNKPWGVLALAPCLLAAERGRLRLLAGATAVPGAWLALFYSVAPTALRHSLSGLSPVARPQEVWWPLSHLRVLPGVTPYSYVPALVAGHARELALLLALPLTAPLARRPGRTEADCLALLALLFLVRCLLDPADLLYYHLPLMIALLAWESRARTVPVITAVALGAVWLAFNAGVGTSGQFGIYVAAMLALAAVLAEPALGVRISSLGMPFGLRRAVPAS